jgi:D-amino peptidase
LAGRCSSRWQVGASVRRWRPGSTPPARSRALAGTRFDHRRAGDRRARRCATASAHRVSRERRHRTHRQQLGHGSGDVVVAFTIADRIPERPIAALRARHVLAEPRLERLFDAAAEATEQAIIDAIFSAVTVTGRDGHVRRCLVDVAPDGPPSPMKVLISVDIEGVAGVVHREQTTRGNPEYERARRLMTAEANAAIAGALAGGATDVLVNDSHGDFRNLLADELDPRARYLQGKPRELGMMAGVDDGCAAVFLVGWHAKAGGAGILAHTISSFAFARVVINGTPIGEAGLYGAVAAEFGVPVALITGDDAFIAETSPLFAGVTAVAVKRAFGNQVADSLSPKIACAAIEAGAREAAGRVATLRIAPVERSLQVRVQTTSTAMADLFALLPIVRRVEPATIEFVSPTMRHAVRVLNSLSAMSFMLR